MKQLFAVLALLLALAPAALADMTYQVTCTTTGASVFPALAFDTNGNLKPSFSTYRKSVTLANQNASAIAVFICDGNNNNLAAACSGCTSSTGLQLLQNAAFTDTLGHGNLCCTSASTTVTLAVILR